MHYGYVHFTGVDDAATSSISSRYPHTSATPSSPIHRQI